MPDPEQLLAAIRLAKNHYFKKTMDKRGRFIYEYSLSQKKKLPRYNMLRHAGTVYAMLQTAELTRKNTYVPLMQALEPIQQAIHAGLEFQLQMQVKGDIKHSRKWLGGFMESLEKDTIRIDYTQHNISGLILYHQILGGEFPGPGRRRRDPPGV